MPKEELPNIKSSSGHIHKNSGAHGQKNVNKQVTAGPSKSNPKQNQKDAAEKETPVPPTSQLTRDQKKFTKKGKTTAPQSQTSGHIKLSTADTVKFQSEPAKKPSHFQESSTSPTWYDSPPIDTRCECCNVNFGGLLALKRHIMDSMQHWACLACPYGISTDFHSEKDLAEHFEIYHLPAYIPFSKTKAKYYKTPTFCARCAIPTFPSVVAAQDHFYPPTQLSSPDREHFPCQRMASVGGCIFDGKTANDLYRHWAESDHALLCNGCDGWFRSGEELLAHWEKEGACRVFGTTWGEQVEQRAWCEENHMQFEWEDGMEGLGFGEGGSGGDN
ncbi:uncharacterized protein IWZ02DRAFT_490493 [Phyllosticta citriasiana]|uniref:uncharacterized protein n=1 Tax=Phyllosticta citriasiana TaxID=595635 RepID=UPI0030FDAD2E